MTHLIAYPLVTIVALVCGALLARRGDGWHRSGLGLDIPLIERFARDNRKRQR